MFKKEKIKDLHYTINGVLTADEITEKSDAILSKYGEKAKIPGFRPGRIPLATLRQKFGGDAVQDAINELVNADLDAFKADKKIRMAGRPNLNIDKWVPGGDCEYTIEFDVLPELPKIELEKIALKKIEKPVLDKDINEALENLRKSNSTFEKQADGYKLQKGDIAVIDFTGYLGDTKFQGGEGKNHSLTLGGGQFIPGFEDQIIGRIIGDEFDVNVKFPDEYHAPDLAGKAARFAVKIHEAKKPILPPIDDELAKKVGMESADKLRAEVKNVLENNAKDAAQSEMRNELLDILNDKVKMDIPETIVIQELDLARKNNPNNFDEKKERKDAERRVKLGLILAEWGNLNEVKVTREELQGAIWAEAARYPNPQEVIEFYNKNQNAVSMLNGMLFERKVLDKMIEMCKVK